jgi:hypothetical protein
VLLLALPFTIGFDMLVPGRADVVIHAALGVGTFLVGVAVFDFSAPTWLTRMGAGAALALAAIFFAQGVASLTQNETLNGIAYSQAIGGWAESLTVSVVMAWLIAAALRMRRGPTMLFGVVSAALVIGLSVWGTFAGPSAGTPAELRLLFLLPIAWLLFVSTRRRRAI